MRMPTSAAGLGTQGKWCAMNPGRVLGGGVLLLGLLSLGLLRFRCVARRQTDAKTLVVDSILGWQSAHVHAGLRLRHACTCEAQHVPESKPDWPQAAYVRRLTCECGLHVLTCFACRVETDPQHLWVGPSSQAAQVRWCSVYTRHSRGGMHLIMRQHSSAPIVCWCSWHSMLFRLLDMLVVGRCVLNSGPAPALKAA
jgi:hypothetical protein